MPHSGMASDYTRVGLQRPDTLQRAPAVRSAQYVGPRPYNYPGAGANNNPNIFSLTAKGNTLGALRCFYFYLVLLPRETASPTRIQNLVTSIGSPHYPFSSPHGHANRPTGAHAIERLFSGRAQIVACQSDGKSGARAVSAIVARTKRVACRRVTRAGRRQSRHSRPCRHCHCPDDCFDLSEGFLVRTPPHRWHWS